MLTPTQILLLFGAGGLGTLARYGCHQYFSALLPQAVPYSTTLINIIGCFCFGLIATLFATNENWSLTTRTIILTGFFGAFTTFSTYMYEFHSLLTHGSVLHAVIGFMLQNGVGFLALLAGMFCVRSHPL
ncbi:MAG: CrcB family protein [Planctomycetia bacterium]|nr:CrcB family protein [Planctomycetia bacterium]